ncbi:MAG: hypothetical protein QOI98_1893 [Solirubrobacteraceae bacterium]|nr:hypothetical protein [Solirubrobacteraceae bacterium]
MLFAATLWSSLALAVSADAATVPGCAAPGPGGDWPIYGNTVDNHHDQTAEHAITTANVGKLKLAWQLAMPDAGVIQSVPVEAEGCVFTGTSNASVLAVNATTGRIVWSNRLAQGGGGNPFVGAGIIGAPAVANGLVYVAVTTPTASIEVALDEATGTLVWSKVFDTDAGGGVDASPVPFNGMVLQAFQGDESASHSNPGFVILDGSRAGDGAILVKTHVIPAADYAAGYRGASIVDTPSVDVERKLAYAGTGNPVSPAQHPLTNSLLKIDLDPAHPTFGKILASRRGTSDSYPLPKDTTPPTCLTNVQWPLGRFSCFQFDYNFISTPNLWTDSQGRRLYGGLQKSGVFLTVDTANMQQVWRKTIAIPCFGCNIGSMASDANALYVPTVLGNLFSLNRDTGAIKWVAPLTGVTHINGVSVANGVVYNLNDLGLLEAFSAANGRPLLVHPLALDTRTFTYDLGNSSGISIARHAVFVTSQAGQSGSRLFAFRVPGV